MSILKGKYEIRLDVSFPKIRKDKREDVCRILGKKSQLVNVDVDGLLKNR
jgi:hypothetical protein